MCAKSLVCKSNLCVKPKMTGLKGDMEWGQHPKDSKNLYYTIGIFPWIPSRNCVIDELKV